MGPVETEFWLSRNLKEAFQLPQDAVDWTMSVWNAIQVFDDMADGDFPDRDKLNTAILDLLVNMPQNLWFLKNAHHLIPILRLCVLKWKAADDAERAGEADAKSFMWRASFYDLLLSVVAVVHGDSNALDIARHVMALYGENFDEYMREMSVA